MDNSLKLLFLLNMADISLTKYLTGLGAQELNPIVSYLLSVSFFWALLFKAAMAGTFIWVVVRLGRHLAGVRRVVLGANIFFVFLVLYQLVGVALLS